MHAAQRNKTNSALGGLLGHPANKEARRIASGTHEGGSFCTADVDRHRLGRLCANSRWQPSVGFQVILTVKQHCDGCNLPCGGSTTHNCFNRCKMVRRQRLGAGVAAHGRWRSNLRCTKVAMGRVMRPEQPDPQTAGPSGLGCPSKTVPEEVLELWASLPRCTRQWSR